MAGWCSFFNSTLTFQSLCCGFNNQARSHLTTVSVPSGFWLGSNIKGVEEITSCLRSTDVGVRRSAYYLVVAHQHHRHFVSSLTLVIQKMFPTFDNISHLLYSFSQSLSEFISLMKLLTMLDVMNGDSFRHSIGM